MIRRACLAAALLFLAAAPAIACEGCRAGKSPSSHLSALVLLVFLPVWLCYVGAGYFARTSGPAGTSRSRDWLGGAALIALACAIGFGPTFLVESFCWYLLENGRMPDGWERHLYQLNNAVKWIGAVVMAAGVLVARRPEAAPLRDRLGGPASPLHPIAGCWPLLVALNGATAPGHFGATLKIGVAIQLAAAVVMLARASRASRRDGDHGEQRA